jgi:hypothetical protein
MNEEMKLKKLHSHKYFVTMILALVISVLSLSSCAQTNITPEEARVIAKEAYIYGYPMVDSYRIYYSYFVDSKDPEFKAPWNKLRNTPRVYTPDDKTIQTPNSDTPYSALGFDLRTEPIVFTVPVIEMNRYFSVQLIDAYTFNFAYIGSRATGIEPNSLIRLTSKTLRKYRQAIRCRLCHSFWGNRRPWHRRRLTSSSRSRPTSSATPPISSRSLTFL